MANHVVITAEKQTTSKRASDRTRQKRAKRKRTGRPGRKSQSQIEHAAAIMDKYRNHAFDFFAPNELPTLTPQQVRVVNCLLLPNTDCLTNVQIGELLGISRQTVDKFRESRAYYEALAHCTVFEKKLEVLEAQSIIALERNIVEDRDNAAIKMVLVMRQRLDEAHRNVFNISADTIQIGVGQTLKNLPAPKQQIEEAEYTVEQGSSNTETGDKQEQ